MESQSSTEEFEDEVIDVEVVEFVLFKDQVEAIGKQPLQALEQECQMLLVELSVYEGQGSKVTNVPEVRLDVDPILYFEGSLVTLEAQISVPATI